MTDGRCVDRAVSCFHAGLKNMTYLAVCVVAVSCQEFRTQKDARLKAVRVAPDRACDSKGPVVIDDVAVSCGDPGRRGLLTISSRRFFFFLWSSVGRLAQIPTTSTRTAWSFRMRSSCAKRRGQRDLDSASDVAADSCSTLLMMTYRTCLERPFHID